MDWKNHKKFVILGFVLVILSLFLINLENLNNSKKIDDWEYSHNPSKNSTTSPLLNISIDMFISLGIILIIFGLAWFGTSIYLIIKPKSRILGISLILVPVCILALGVLLAFLTSWTEIILLLILILFLIFFILEIIYSIKKQIYFALIPIILLIILLTGAFCWTMVLRAHITSATEEITSTGDIQESSAGPKMGSTSRDIGYSVGGAKDINNFRENIENDYLPLPTDITYEGLFYDYYFDTGQKESCSQLFCPSYSYATSIDPISNETDNYLSVGLNSGIKDFERKKLNLVIVLDISGSMGSSFKNYYYDGEKQESSDESKMTIATGAVADLLGHLKPDDRFGMVLFENNAHKAKPLRKVDRTDMTAIRNHILEISSTGGTNFEAGYKKGTELFNEHLTNNPEYENRIIFLTDAMPNRGVTGEEGLLGLTKSNANDKIHTSFIGMGVDFNTELIEQITKIRGANYYSVHSAEEFQKRMDDQFEYMVTPLVFNLTLNLDAQGYDIEKVYGSPEANETTGEIMKVNTLFPSEKKQGKTKGGIVLLKLDRQSPEASMKLSVDYETREGEKKHSEKSVTLEDKENFYDNSGIRKAILLSRYADLMKNWIIDERNNYENQEPVTPRVNKNDGIIVPKALGKWERQSVPLQVSEEYKEIFQGFTKYYKDEMNKLNDTTLSKELDILNTLIKSSKGTS